MAKLGIIRKGGIEEIVFEEDRPKLIFGKSNAPSQKKERKSIGHALVKTGLEVYATNVLWPYNSYILNNGLVLPESEFGVLGDGGYYVFGDGFVLVSGLIKEGLEEKLRDSEHFRDFFSGSEVVFVPPYSRRIKGIEGSELRPWHIDITVNYVPGARLLSVARGHYRQEKELFEELRERFGVDVKRDTAAKLYPNNFFVVQYNGQVYVITNRLNNPFKGRTNGFKVIETERDIINLPGKFGGSIQCAANKSPTTKLWDALGIEYRRWGVNPNQASYAMH